MSASRWKLSLSFTEYTYSRRSIPVKLEGVRKNPPDQRKGTLAPGRCPVAGYISASAVLKTAASKEDRGPKNVGPTIREKSASSQGKRSLRLFLLMAG